MNERKNAGADLRRSYNILLQFGLIVALLFIIGLVKINLYSAPPQAIMIDEQEEVVMEEEESQFVWFGLPLPLLLLPARQS